MPRPGRGGSAATQARSATTTRCAPLGTRNYKVGREPLPQSGWSYPRACPPEHLKTLAAQLHIDTTHPNKTLRESQEREDPLSPVIPVVTPSECA